MGEVSEKITQVPVQSQEQQEGLVFAVLQVGGFSRENKPRAAKATKTTGHLKAVTQNKQLSSQLCFFPSHN